MAMMRVTGVQMDALRAIGAGRTLRGFDGRTRDALEDKGLAVRSDTAAGGWELTGEGRLLLGEVTDAPEGPRMPADPFADFDQFDTEGLRPTWMVPTTTPAVRAAVREVTGAPEPMDESIGRITAVLVSADRARLAYVLDEGAAGIYVVDIAHVVPPREVDHLDNTWQLLEGNPL